MTDTIAAVKEPLGAGRIIGGSFGLFFGRFGVLFLLAFVPMVLLQILQLVILGSRSSFQRSSSGSLADFDTYLALVEAFAPAIIAYAFVTAVIVLAAYDAKLGRPVRIKAYVLLALSRLILVTIVTVLGYVFLIFIGIAMFLAFGFVVRAVSVSGGLLPVVIVFLVFSLPVLYFFSVLCVSTTAVVVEHVGLGAFGRSIALTKNYRWPIVGVLLVLYGFVFGANWVLGRMLSPITISDPFLSYLASLLTTAAISSVFAGVVVVGHVLIYARLREIKDGATVDQLADVFD